MNKKKKKKRERGREEKKQCLPSCIKQILFSLRTLARSLAFKTQAFLNKGNNS